MITTGGIITIHAETKIQLYSFTHHRISFHEFSNKPPHGVAHSSMGPCKTVDSEGSTIIKRIIKESDT